MLFTLPIIISVIGALSPRQDVQEIKYSTLTAVMEKGVWQIVVSMPCNLSCFVDSIILFLQVTVLKENIFYTSSETGFAGLVEVKFSGHVYL